MGTSSYVGDIFQQYFTYLPGMLTLVYFTYMLNSDLKSIFFLESFIIHIRQWFIARFFRYFRSFNLYIVNKFEYTQAQKTT